MDNMINSIESILSIITRIDLRNILEIALLSFMVYMILNWILNSRAYMLLRGILVIGMFFLICLLLDFTTIIWIMSRLTTIAVTALIVIFQPELRKALETLGNAELFGIKLLSPTKLRPNTSDSFNDTTVGELTKAAFAMSKTRTGALIVIERNDLLDSIIETGITLDAVISRQLLINIFEHNTPLHDGAVVIRSNEVAAATCYLPLSSNQEINKSLGTRHRAAIGISEVSDAVTIVVSEETGNVSIAYGGQLDVMDDIQTMKEYLSSFKKEEKAKTKNGLKFIRGRGKDEETAVK
jgi:diadenylate cyclase